MNNTLNQNILGNSIDIKIGTNTSGNYSEVRADVPVTQYQSLRLWGQVKDNTGNPIPYALLKLIKSTGVGNTYSGISHATADCQGFYQFDICPDDAATYKLLASKPNTGPELVIQNNGNCPGTEPEYNPCPSVGLSTFSLSDNTCV